jgi:hypothetical protein
MKPVKAEEKPVENKEEVKKENVLFKYNNFLSFIKEAEEIAEGDKPEDDKSGQVSDPKVMNVSQKIKDYWDKNVDIKKFVLSRTQEEKIQINFDKVSKNIMITGLDPIIEIVKVFNRAYKLHTTQVIPTGREGGRVSNKTFMEYTAFGSGASPASAGQSGGPYRNNAIFDQWENAVQNIIKDTKYQPIFREETVLKTADGNIIKEAGKNLLRFINEMLDGDTLYKSGDSKSGLGSQAQFIEKYFGATEEQLKSTIGDGGLGYGKDQEEVNGISDGIDTKNLDFTDSPLKFKDYKDLVGSFFASNSDDNKQFYFYIQAIENGVLYISYCKSMYFFKKYITESGSVKISKNKLPLYNDNQTNKDGKEYVISAFKMKPESLINTDGKFLLNGTYMIKHITRYDEGKNKAAVSKLGKEETEATFKNFYTLQEKGKNEQGQDTVKRFILTNATNSITKNGGFTNIVGANDIKNTAITVKK